MTLTDGSTDGDYSTDVIAALTRVELADAQLRARLRQRLQLNSTDLAALQYVERCETNNRGAYAKDLVHILGVTSAATTTILDRLAHAGHVLRTPDPASRRLRLLTLTDSTRTVLTEMIGGTQTRLRGLLAAMSHRERQRTVRMMDEIRCALEAGACDPSPELHAAS